MSQAVRNEVKLDDKLRFPMDRPRTGLWLVWHVQWRFIASPTARYLLAASSFLSSTLAIHESAAHCVAHLLDNVFGDPLLLTFYSGYGQLYEKAVSLHHWR